MVLYITVLLTLYLVPLGMHSPCIKERSSLGSAPALIGHRGAPMVHFIILFRLFRFKHLPLIITFFYAKILLFQFNVISQFSISKTIIISTLWEYRMQQTCTMCRLKKKQCLCCIFSQLAPENTYMSFEKALAAGADGLESDVTIRSTPKKVCFI